MTHRWEGILKSPFFFAIVVAVSIFVCHLISLNLCQDGLARFSLQPVSL